MLLIPCKHLYLWIFSHSALREGVQVDGNFDFIIVNVQTKWAAINSFGSLLGNYFQGINWIMTLYLHLISWR
ncbi:hypothetical protein AF383_24345, partial [Salmonella enterica subsp. enterica serovar Typhimurium]